MTTNAVFGDNFPGTGSRAGTIGCCRRRVGWTLRAGALKSPSVQLKAPGEYNSNRCKERSGALKEPERKTSANRPAATMVMKTRHLVRPDQLRSLTLALASEGQFQSEAVTLFRCQYPDSSLIRACLRRTRSHPTNPEFQRWLPCNMAIRFIQ